MGCVHEADGQPDSAGLTTCAVLAVIWPLRQLSMQVYHLRQDLMRKRTWIKQPASLCALCLCHAGQHLANAKLSIQAVQQLPAH